MSTLKVNTIRHTGASSDAVTLATDGTCTVKATNRSSNLIINGAMNVAQRGTSAAQVDGYGSVDSFKCIQTSVPNHPTQEQVNVSSSTTPYSLGFRKAAKIVNGDNAANAADILSFKTIIEAQDMATSGWNYTSASSYVTLSFWVKSSVAQNFYGYFRTHDGTQQIYPFETGSLSADTWTKITKTIPGSSNVQFDIDNGSGLSIEFIPYLGANRTDSGVSLNTWAAWGSGMTRTPDTTATWYETNNATLEFTGFQLEVGDVATDFEHRSFGDELARCQRYFFAIPYGSSGDSSTMIQNLESYAKSATEIQSQATFPVPMRSNPSFTGSSTDCDFFADNSSADFAVSGFAVYVTATGANITGMNLRKSGTSSMTGGQAGRIIFRENDGYMHFSAEF
tara:strand:+ start:115 stop:1299 length:1185 start_codon:yes stop_codon:yes gene_type:complete